MSDRSRVNSKYSKFNVVTSTRTKQGQLVPNGRRRLVGRQYCQPPLGKVTDSTRAIRPGCLVLNFLFREEKRATRRDGIEDPSVHNSTNILCTDGHRAKPHLLLRPPPPPCFHHFSFSLASSTNHLHVKVKQKIAEVVRGFIHVSGSLISPS
jgi:hypothetical protein